MDTLPEDMLHYLFRFLNLRSKLSLGATCRKLYEFETEKNIKRFEFVSCVSFLLLFFYNKRAPFQDVTSVIATEHMNKHELDLSDHIRAKKAVTVFRKARIKDFAVRVRKYLTNSKKN